MSWGFYDILKSIRDKYNFDYPEEKLIDLAKKVKSVVDDKVKHTDWSSKSDINASLQYAKVLAQVENYKKYEE